MSNVSDQAVIYARDLSSRVKSYIDLMLAPFLGTRVKIYFGTIVKVDKATRTMQVRIEGVPETSARWIAPSLPGKIDGRRARFLLDSRTRQLWYSDVLPKNYPNG